MRVDYGKPFMAKFFLKEGKGGMQQYAFKYARMYAEVGVGAWPEAWVGRGQEATVQGVARACPIKMATSAEARSENISFSSQELDHERREEGEEEEVQREEGVEEREGGADGVQVKKKDDKLKRFRELRLRRVSRDSVMAYSS